MATKLNQWTRRVTFPDVAAAKLGFGVEYWNMDPAQYEGSEQLATRLKSLGRNPKKRDLAYDLCSHLLDDVVVAAGGVENSIQRLRSAIKDLQAITSRLELRAQGGIPHGLSDPAAVVAWYAFADLLAWSRTLVERMERSPGDRRNFREQGLIPALKPKRLKARCEKLLSTLRSGPVGQSRYLANFILHTALVNHPYSGVRIDARGSVILPVPDLPSQRVSHWYALTWTQEQDGLVLAEQIGQSVQRFMDDLISAFEKSVPKRLRRAAPQ